MEKEQKHNTETDLSKEKEEIKVTPDADKKEINETSDVKQKKKKSPEEKILNLEDKLARSFAEMEESKKKV